MSGRWHRVYLYSTLAHTPPCLRLQPTLESGVLEFGTRLFPQVVPWGDRRSIDSELGSQPPVEVLDQSQIYINLQAVPIPVHSTRIDEALFEEPTPDFQTQERLNRGSLA